MRTYPGDESKRYHVDGKPCSGPPMSYSYAISDSTRRMAARENQVWCLQCEIWVWPEHIAEGHETSPKKRIKERKK